MCLYATYRLNFGKKSKCKHNGKMLKDIPIDYLNWLRKQEDLWDSTRKAINEYLKYVMKEKVSETKIMFGKECKKVHVPYYVWIATGGIRKDGTYWCDMEYTLKWKAVLVPKSTIKGKELWELSNSMIDWLANTFDWETCPRCHGTAWIHTYEDCNPCELCKGSGINPYDRGATKWIVQQEYAKRLVAVQTLIDPVNMIAGPIIEHLPEVDDTEPYETKGKSPSEIRNGGVVETVYDLVPNNDGKMVRQYREVVHRKLKPSGWYLVYYLDMVTDGLVNDSIGLRPNWREQVVKDRIRGKRMKNSLWAKVCDVMDDLENVKDLDDFTDMLRGRVRKLMMEMDKIYQQNCELGFDTMYLVKLQGLLHDAVGIAVEYVFEVMLKSENKINRRGELVNTDPSRLIYRQSKVSKKVLLRKIRRLKKGSGK